MCNRARFAQEPETLGEIDWWTEKPMDNRFNPKELFPKSRVYVVCEQDDRRGIDVMSWDVLGGGAKWPMTNVRSLGLPQWRKLAEKPENRCLIPLTEFCEWTPDLHQVGDGKPIKGEMWFAVERPIFMVAGFWQQTAKGAGFAMVTCDPNELVAPIHPKAMITILEPGDEERWLRGSYDDVVALQRPYAAERMTMRGPVFPTRTKREGQNGSTSSAPLRTEARQDGDAADHRAHHRRCWVGAPTRVASPPRSPDMLLHLAPVRLPFDRLGLRRDRSLDRWRDPAVDPFRPAPTAAEAHRHDLPGDVPAAGVEVGDDLPDGEDRDVPAGEAGDLQIGVDLGEIVERVDPRQAHAHSMREQIVIR